MWGWVKASFEWLSKQITPLLEGIFEAARKFKWFVVALIAALLAPINWILDWLGEAFRYAVEQTADIYAKSQALDIGQAQSFWQSIAVPAGLMNCVVPLDYALSMGTLLFGWIILFGMARALFWLIRLLSPISS